MDWGLFNFVITEIETVPITTDYELKFKTK